MNAPTHDPAAEERASYWAARLDGSVLSAADQSALNAWLGKNPAHRALLSSYCQFSADLEVLLPALAESGLVERPQELSPPRRRPALAWAAGLALAAAAVAAVVWTRGWTHTEYTHLATAAAQRQTLTLADGTRAELNAQTSLQIELGPTERHVRLASGEAFFTVTKDKSRPFIVETPSGSVRVTGTVFDVCSETPSALEVLVVEGSVQVRPGESATGHTVTPVVLGAGDRLSAGADGVAVSQLPAGAMNDALAWRSGQVVFDNTPLRTALARFARYHGRGISATPAAANLSIGGRFSLDDLDGFLGALETILPVRVTRNLSGTVRVELADPAPHRAGQ